MINVVFLDIDGVLNSDAYVQRLSGAGRSVEDYIAPLHGAPKLDPVAVRYLNEALRCYSTSDASVVISSSWRQRCSLGQIWKALSEAGFSGDLIGRTPVLRWGKRGHEIQAWLNEHWVRGIAILDDSEDMVHLSPWLVKIDPAVGLTRDNAAVASRLIDAGRTPHPDEGAAVQSTYSHAQRGENG